MRQPEGALRIVLASARPAPEAPSSPAASRPPPPPPLRPPASYASSPALAASASGCGGPGGGRPAAIAARQHKRARARARPPRHPRRTPRSAAHDIARLPTPPRNPKIRMYETLKNITCKFKIHSSSGIAPRVTAGGERRHTHEHDGACSPFTFVPTARVGKKKKRAGKKMRDCGRRNEVMTKPKPRRQ